MKTSVIQDFFSGTCDAEALARDLAGCVVRTSHDVCTQYIEDDASGVIAVNTGDLLKMCDAFSSRHLNAAMIEQVAFALMASDHFDWDHDTAEGKQVAEVVDWWDSPEINYPLTDSTMAKFRHYLQTGEDLFTQVDLVQPPTQAKPNMARTKK